MLGPMWARVAFATALTAVAASCLARLLSTERRWSRHEDVGQVWMSLGMIAMFLSWTGLGPRLFWLVVFGSQAVLAVALFVWPATRPRLPEATWTHINHVMGSLAMAYLAAATMTAPRTTLATHSMVALPELAASFATCSLLFTIWSVVRTVRLIDPPVRAADTASRASHSPTALLRRPRLIAACRTIMGISMTYMLLTAG